MGKIRGTHSSPGTYTQITDLSYAAKTLGITTLGLVGETLKGPAFEPIAISDWGEFVDRFGGTSPELFSETKYPKYEAPYIAKSYLKKSDQMYMCRVLGLSGYNAGPAFVITAEGDGGKYVVAVLRSRGTYRKYVNLGTTCEPNTKYDTLEFDCDGITMSPYNTVSMIRNGCEINGSTSAKSYDINLNNLGQFTLQPTKDGDPIGAPLVVSLNAGTKDYIYNVIGSKANEGSAAIYVEELYDVMLQELVEKGKVSKISTEIQTIPEVTISAVCNPVSDFVTITEQSLTRKYLGTTYVCDEAGSDENGFTYHKTDNNGLVTESGSTYMEVGAIYTVAAYTNENGKKSYVYVQLKDEDGDAITVGEMVTGKTYSVDAVKVRSANRFVYIDEGDLVFLSDMNDYHEQFRCATTPWIVSELKGDGKNLQVKKLFRFHTISDGNTANAEVKISIANIRPDDGRFDVLVRDFNDSDSSPVILESYRGLTMEQGDSKYIGLAIGTLDGKWESKSKYIMAEIVENDMTENCVPCGFLGYPVRTYGEGIKAPYFAYNISYDETIREKKQYFGLSDITGVDVDMLYYKGKNAYTEDYTSGYTNAFHLDSTLNSNIQKQLNIKVTIDGEEETSGVTWEAVSPDTKYNTTDDSPVIGSEEEMESTIYKTVAMRKFTVYPYGGFDGWDVYRNKRTNTDEYRVNKYKGTISNGYGQTFSRVDNGTALCLEGSAITSDYYAYLAGANQFENPEKYVINLFATPGIDYVNNTLLSEDILEMIEDKRYDSLYIPTTPDKPAGNGDSVDEMYSASDVADNLADTDIDTYYAATYYPWVKYFDSDNNVYIFLPPTKDVLRVMADVDNKRYPWIAPAGTERGVVDCKKMRFFSKIEDEDNVYDGYINPLKTFSKEGVIIWGDKTMYSGDTPMNRVNVVRLVLYMRKLIIESTRKLIFEPNDTTLKNEFESIVKPILSEIQTDRGITAYQLKVSQTAEQMDAHEMSCKLWIKPTPTLEYIEIDFVVTPQGVEFDD